MTEIVGSTLRIASLCAALLTAVVVAWTIVLQVKARASLRRYHALRLDMFTAKPLASDAASNGREASPRSSSEGVAWSSRAAFEKALLFSSNTSEAFGRETLLSYASIARPRRGHSLRKVDNVQKPLSNINDIRMGSELITNERKNAS